jgi:hypothetical protein
LIVSAPIVRSVPPVEVHARSAVGLESGSGAEYTKKEVDGVAKG